MLGFCGQTRVRDERPARHGEWGPDLGVPGPSGFESGPFLFPNLSPPIKRRPNRPLGSRRCELRSRRRSFRDRQGTTQGEALDPWGKPDRMPSRN
eukprot:3372677-Pyramimonas_sp.AAC.1